MPLSFIVYQYIIGLNHKKKIIENFGESESRAGIWGRGGVSIRVYKKYISY